MVHKPHETMPMLSFEPRSNVILGRNVSTIPADFSRLILWIFSTNQLVLYRLIYLLIDRIVARIDANICKEKRKR